MDHTKLGGVGEDWLLLRNEWKPLRILQKDLARADLRLRVTGFFVEKGRKAGAGDQLGDDSQVPGEGVAGARIMMAEVERYGQACVGRLDGRLNECLGGRLGPSRGDCGAA